MRFLSIDIFLNLAFPFQNEVSDLMYNWVAQGPDFKSALRVVKMVLNTQCYQYLTMQKIKRNTKKNQNRWFYYVNLAPELNNDEKLPKKTDHSIAIYSIFSCHSSSIPTRAVDRIFKSQIKSDLKSPIKSHLSDFLTGRKPLLLWSF